ncbi:MAG: metallopeptidase family protein [Acidobacteria bacterium]|nr:metallopeptidase family protein [Acidobacteriota bacterium]
MRLSRKEFDRVVSRSLRRIPREIRENLENIVISVANRPSPELLEEMGVPPGETLLGAYRGVSLTDRSALEPPLYPDMILLFQKPLEEMCGTTLELERQVEITLVHEIAHYLGIDEERLATLGYE